MSKIKTFFTATSVAIVSTLAFAPAAMAEAHGGGASADGMIALAAGLCLAVAALGAALGQGRAVAAAMESIGRNPASADRIQTPMIIGVAFIEALAIYALVIAFSLVGKIA